MGDSKPPCLHQLLCPCSQIWTMNLNHGDPSGALAARLCSCRSKVTGGDGSDRCRGCALDRARVPAGTSSPAWGAHLPFYPSRRAPAAPHRCFSGLAVVFPPQDPRRPWDTAATRPPRTETEAHSCPQEEDSTRQGPNGSKGHPLPKRRRALNVKYTPNFEDLVWKKEM